MNFSCLRINFYVLVMILINTSCDLSENLTGQPTIDKFFQTKEDFDSYIKGAYSPLIELYGSDIPYVAGSGADDVFTPVIRWKGFEHIDINSVGNPDEITEMLWNSYYKSISSCNTLINIINESSNESISKEDLSLINAEARFLRAFNYFQLVRWFGEVPLLTEDNQNNASKEKQSTVERIYEYIVSDLKIAETNLSDMTRDSSRPNIWTAKSLLAKVYLAMAGFPLNKKQYNVLAKDKAYEIIKAEVYSLEKNFSQLWIWDNRKSNSEFIFTLYASSDNGLGSYLHQAVRPVDGGENGWGDWTGDKLFLQTFENGDKRIAGSFYLRTSDGTSWENTNIAQPYVGKYRDAGPKSGGYAGISIANKADGFFCLIRYSEILLVYAEAANLAEGNPSEKAYESINKVRERAGLKKISELTTIQFDEAVLNERKYEFAFEGKRWFDLCRRHILKETMIDYYDDIDIDDHNYLLPKPNSQLSIMTGISQNPGYN